MPGNHQQNISHIVVQHLNTCLQCTATSPEHLLFLYKALAVNVVHGRFDEGRGYRLVMPVAVTVVWDKRLSGLDIGGTPTLTFLSIKLKENMLDKPGGNTHKENIITKSKIKMWRKSSLFAS
jgi:hypothetical protein